MIDWVSGLAVALGALALAIAVWDHAADAVLIALRRPLSFSCSIKRDSPTYFEDGRRTIHVIAQWKVKNRLTYPLVASFGWDGPEAWPMTGIRLGADLLGILSGTQTTLPPHQPMDFWLCVPFAEGTMGEFVPRINVAPSGRRLCVCGDSYSLG